MLDNTDLEIISLLKRNSRMQWREIGEKVHMTGQAVANRIKKLEELGIINGYTIYVNESKLGKSIISYITVFMKTTDHKSFHEFLIERDEVMEAHRISGEGCYQLKTAVSSQEELESLLNCILNYGNYRVNMSISKVK
ncbi:MAG: Lrp/AsnC family transcriptional regulator [Bacillota bacterium]|nr:Lrp/AsnC family transcriptional regulator [Bacillota bacterium]